MGFACIGRGPRPVAVLLGGVGFGLFADGVAGRLPTGRRQAPDIVIDLAEVRLADLVRMTLRVTETDARLFCDDRGKALRHCGTEEAARRDLSSLDLFC